MADIDHPHSDDVPAVRFGAAERRTTWIGFRQTQIALLSIGVGVAMILGASVVMLPPVDVPGPVGGIVALVVLAAVAVAVARPLRGGMYLDELLPWTVRSTWRRARGRHRHANPIARVGSTATGAYTAQQIDAAMPPAVRGLRLLTGRTPWGWKVGVIHDPQCDGFSAVMRIAGRDQTLVDVSGLTGTLDSWARVLESLCDPSTAVRRVALTSVACPDYDGTELYRYHGRAARLPLDHAANGSYLDLLDQAAPTSTVHETFVTIQVAPSKLPRWRRARLAPDHAAEMIEVLIDAMRQMKQTMAGAGVQVLDEMLDPRELARAWRYAFSPGDRIDLTRRDDHTDPDDRGIDWSGVWPLSLDDALDHAITDGTFHAGWWIGQWPPRPVAATFLHPLLLRTAATRRFQVVFRPLDPIEAIAAAEERELIAESSARLRDDKDIHTKEETRRRDAATTAEVTELHDGAAPYAFTGWLTVSAPTEQQLIDDAAELARQAAQSRLRLVRARGSHANALAWTLPGNTQGLRGWDL